MQKDIFRGTESQTQIFRVKKLSFAAVFLNVFYAAGIVSIIMQCHYCNWTSIVKQSVLGNWDHFSFDKRSKIGYAVNYGYRKENYFVLQTVGRWMIWFTNGKRSIRSRWWPISPCQEVSKWTISTTRAAMSKRQQVLFSYFEIWGMLFHFRKIIIRFQMNSLLKLLCKGKITFSPLSNLVF